MDKMNHAIYKVYTIQTVKNITGGITHEEVKRKQTAPGKGHTYKGE